MVYRQLGKSQLQVSAIGFGCMSLEQGNPGNTALLHQAIDYGINFFDTADLYQQGWNEEIVGNAIKEKRDRIVLASKVGNQWRSDGSGWDWNPRPDYILQAVDKTLRRLQTDYLDLYQLHGGTIDDPVDDIIDTFERLQQQGKIRYYGISSIRPNVIREYIKRSHITSVMMQYSLLDRRPEEECLALLQQHQVSVLARGALAKGLLCGKPASAYAGHSPAEVAKAAAIIAELSSNERNCAQTAIAYALQHPAVAVAVTGFRTLAQLTAGAGTPLIPLSEQEHRLLAAAVQATTYTEHR